MTEASYATPASSLSRRIHRRWKQTAGLHPGSLELLHCELNALNIRDFKLDMGYRSINRARESA
jgi:hypothetical protein